MVLISFKLQTKNAKKKVGSAFIRKKKKKWMVKEQKVLIIKKDLKNDLLYKHSSIKYVNQMCKQ